MTTIGDCVATHARQRPAERFCTFLAGSTVLTITFAGLLRAARAYACAYRARGVQPGDVVIIILRHSPHLFYSFVGALLARAIPSFMPFPSPKQSAVVYWGDHQTLFDRLKPRLIVSYEENLADARRAIPNFSIDTLIAHDDLLAVDITDDDPARSGAAPDDIACLQHSSGTTGLKKGVMLSHRAVLEQVDAYGKALDRTPADRIISWLPLYHDMGFIACFMTSLIAGIELIALDPFEWVMRPHILLEAIATYQPSLCWLPNFAFSHMVRAVRPSAIFDLHSVRAFINCSEPCKPETFERFVQRFGSSGIEPAQLHVCYAMAENVFAVTQTNLTSAPAVIRVDAQAFSRDTVTITNEPDARALISCGVPLEGVEVHVLAVDGTPVDPGRIGEIYITSPFLFDGYYLQPDLTAKNLVNGSYATGDRGFLHGGELYVTGRVDDMLIVNGRNYYAHEIEAVVNDVAGLIPGRTVAIGIDDDLAEAIVVVILAECHDPEHARDDIGREIRGRVFDRLGLAVHTVELLERGQLVKTTSGKISRTKNKELYLSRALAELGGSITGKI